MELFAVICLTDGYAKEDSKQTSIIGIYSDKTVADSLKTITGPNSKVVALTVDKIHPGHAQLAKEILHLDLEEILEKKAAELQDFTELDRECLMTAEEFLTRTEEYLLFPDDGQGYWATSTQVSSISCWSDQPAWATHVCWYNR